MENKPISRTLRLLSQLMELHEVNPFKIKSIANAAFKVDKLPYPIAGKSFAEMEKIDGIGKSTATKITELLETGTITEMQELLDATPEGVVEMLGIKGIGPKKVAIIWHDLGIENTGELYYACNENRLIEAKGFGLKTQEEIRKSIEFRMASNGTFLYARVEHEANQLLDDIKALFVGALVEFASDFRRLCEVISELVIVVGTRDNEMTINALSQSTVLQNITVEKNHINGELENGLLVDIVCVEKRYFYKELFLQTGNDEHTDAVLKRINDEVDQPESEELIYIKSGLSFIKPELREGTTFIDRAENNNLPQLISYHDLKGTLHNHSTWSDGVNTIEEMAGIFRHVRPQQERGLCQRIKY
jgi:DNA polymerase (family 10)